MSQKQCDECGEAVDEAKAFCPQCGHAFVEEANRDEPSVFDSMEGTMHFGQTMYNQMLSDMGLNIKDQKQTSERAAAETTDAPAETPKPAAERSTALPSKRSRKLLIFGIVGAFLILLLLIAIVAGVGAWLRYS